MENIKKLDKRILIAIYTVLGLLLCCFIMFITFGIKASSSALNYANLTKNDVSYIRFSFEFEDLLPEYEVKWNIGMREHEYKVHAFTGEILGYEMD